jgi:hypothetical protein
MVKGTKLFVAALVCLVSAGLAVGATITDDFSDGDHLVNPTWTVDSGAVTSDGSQAPGSMYGLAGRLNFGTAAGTQVHLDFPAVDNTAVSVEFELYQSNGAGGASYSFNFGLYDSTSDVGYLEHATLNPTYYGSSGFHAYNGSGEFIAGLAGYSLDNSPAIIGMTFDPVTGVTVTKNGDVVASWTNFNGLTKVDRFVLENGNGVVSWFVDDVAVTYVPEPMTMVLLGIGGLSMLRRRR